MKELLFSASKKSGALYEKVIEKEPHLTNILDDIPDIDKVEKDFQELTIKWYMKTGTYCKMSPREFYEETPYWLLKGITEEIDERIKNHKKDILNYEHLALLLALAKAFGGK